MTRKFSGKRLIIASHNQGKVREFKDLLENLGLDIKSAGDLNLAEPEETGVTFIENAELKALAAATVSGLPALADDSGLVVPALGGDPGIYSARWAGPDKDFDAAMALVEDKLGTAGDRSAYFAAALSLAWPDGHRESVEGRVSGMLTFPPRGNKGFGYDPIFVAAGYELTFGEMEAPEKHRISHRANAFEQLVELCFSP